MNEETFNLSIRRFLKAVGIRSQREIEQAVERARADGRIDDRTPLSAEMRLVIPALGVDLKIDGTIELE